MCIQGLALTRTIFDHAWVVATSWKAVIGLVLDPVAMKSITLLISDMEAA